MKKEDPEKVLFTLNEKFRFECHQGLPCFNTCCRDISIFLTPYDVLRMCRSTGLSSQELLEKYTTTMLADDGIPLVMLKMRDDEKETCPFVEPDGCVIYQDRPWSCRMYPVFPLSSEEVEFLIEKRASCLGFQEDREFTVREWKTNQDIDSYDEMNKGYKEITQHEFFQKGNTLDAGKAKLLYSACYDLDWFRKFLFNTKFFEKYDVENDLIERMRNDDEELLKFSYRWVRSILFSEDTLRLKDEAMEKLLQAGGREPS
ncbi:MAG: YkgJ family cysteine cluster protein [Syntrophobacteraceae bacterium]|jgi:hypothetical protein|nr:YkgJ family cysteine cluster protein [Syntrophobacteraceae bacterium]